SMATEVIQTPQGVTLRVTPLVTTRDWCESGGSGAMARVELLLFNRDPSGTAHLDRLPGDGLNEPPFYQKTLCGYRLFPTLGSSPPEVKRGPNYMSDGVAPDLVNDPPAVGLNIPPQATATLYWDVCLDCGTVYVGTVPSGGPTCASPFISGHLFYTPSVFVDSGAAKSGSVQVYRPPSLTATLWADKDTYFVGETISLRLSITNAGQQDEVNFGIAVRGDALGSSATVAFASAVPALPPPPGPPGSILRGSGGCASTVMGQSRSYTVEYVAAGSGKMRFNATADGFGVLAGSPASGTPHTVSVGTMGDITIKDAAHLLVTAEATKVVTMSQPCAGCPLAWDGNVTVSAVVENSGSATAYAVRPVIS
ncbi:MAG: hypothetical protein AAB368_02925, partial [bacterium]